MDLKEDLEQGDSSVAGLLMKVDVEPEMRNFIARELREKQFDRYQIVQEPELADGKKPDIRFIGKGFDAPVPVELKLVKNWTCSELFERMKNQLCGDYLKSQNSYKGKWKKCDNTLIDFRVLLESLKIENEFPGVQDIFIIGIDLSARFKNLTN